MNQLLIVFQILAMPMLLLTALFLIALVLMQRGKGGGLAGAFGGLGGQSAFGTKAGDAFTKFTIIVASVWIVLCVLSVALLSRTKGRFEEAYENTPVQRSNDTGTTQGPVGASQGSEGAAQPED